MTETADFPLIAPPLLEKGDTFGIIAPSGKWEEEHFHQGISILENHGYQVKLPDPLPAGKGYLAGSDRQRLQTIEQIWFDPEVKAVMPIRGGYGALRLLDSLDYQSIRTSPRILVGFSDVSALLHALYKHCQLLTFHGPMLTSLAKCDSTSLNFFFDFLSGRAEPVIKPERMRILKKGDATGPLIGGNLTTLTHLLATRHEVSWQGKIVFLEDVGELPYRVDRLFSHLSMAGRFEGITGLILGEFTNCGNQEEIWKRVLELFQDENFPIWADFPVGHGRRNRTLPLGGRARMDSTAKALTFTLSDRESP